MVAQQIRYGILPIARRDRLVWGVVVKLQLVGGEGRAPWVRRKVVVQPSAVVIHKESIASRVASGDHVSMTRAVGMEERQTVSLVV